MKKILSVILCVTLVFGLAMNFTPLVNAEAAGEGVYTVTSSTGLNLRDSSSTAGTRLCTIPFNTALRVTEIENGWGFTSYSGKSGWICLDYASKQTDPGTINVFERLNELREKFPAGTYWNHMDGVNNPDLTTTTPCPCHPHGANNPMAAAGCTCNTFLGTFQCHGFALKIGYDLFGTNPNTWEKRSNTTEGLSVGDIIRFGSWHTVIVTGISEDGSGLYICDGNWDCHCVIRWDAYFSMNYFTRYAGNYYVLHEQSNNCLLVQDNTAPTVGAVEVSLSNDTALVSCTVSDNNELSFVNLTLSSPAGESETIVIRYPSGSAEAEFDLSAYGESGSYKATATAYDVVGNSASSDVSFNYVAATTTTTNNYFNTTAATQAPTTTTKTTTTATFAPTTTTTASADLPSGGSGIVVNLERLGGENRIETAKLIAEYGWERSGADNAIIVNGYSFADALAGVPLAYALDAPILLSANGEKLEQSVLDELEKLGVSSVYILGGTGVVNAQIQAQLMSDYEVKRLAGEDRYQTAVKIADELEWINRSAPDEVYIAYSGNFPDALSASTVAALTGCPILYVNHNGDIDYYTQKYIKDSKAYRATVLGGTAVIGEGIKSNLRESGIRLVERIEGADRYDTSGKLCESYSSIYSGTGAALATGSSFPDALAGAVLAAKLNIPLVLVGNGENTSEKSFLQSLSAGEIYVFGETDVVPDELVNEYLGF